MKEGKKDTSIRVAQVMGKMIGGGVESFVMNYYRNIDREKVQFDFIIDEDSTYIPREEIESLGGRIITVPPYQKIFKYTKEMIKILKNNKYKIVHSNINSLSVFPLFCAKIAKVPIRIAHSHSTTNKKEWKKDLVKNMLKPFSKMFANEYFCCTEHAGRWLFGNNFFESGKVKVINNAIDVNKFCYNEQIREKIRRQLKIENKFVIGHVGRFIAQKNHERVINVFSEFHKKNNNSILLLVGEGKLKEDIVQKVKKLGLESDVMFLGMREDVNELFQAMDLFLFPSLYEGLGMVLIEAQCSGLHCIASEDVPEAAKVTELVEFVSLDAENSKWIEKILSLQNIKERTSMVQDIKKAEYDIKQESNKLLDIYIGGRND